MFPPEDQSRISSFGTDTHLAASLILIDQRFAAEPRILLGRRHDNHVFLPGKFVFPGGRSEPEDAKMAASGTLVSEALRRLSNPAAGGPVASPGALALTAVREMFEETGFLIGDRTDQPVSAPAGTSWAHFAAARVIPNLAKLHYVARALTPPGFSRRYDTHFFAADAGTIAETIEGHVHAEAELVELRWMAIAELTAFDILPITHFIALELAQRLTAGLGHELSVPYFYAQDDRWIRTEV